MVKQKKILLRCYDDSVIILSFVLDDGYYIKRAGTDAEIDAEIIKASSAFPERLPILDWKEISDSDLPERDYRNAWKTNGKKIEHDMDKAKEIHKEKLRILRFPILQDLDVLYMKADENNNQIDKNKIIFKKQLLRDITEHSSIKNSTTIEELKNAAIDIIEENKTYVKNFKV